LPDDSPPPNDSPAPVVVVTLNNAPITLAAIHDKFAKFEAEDDVFTSEFTTGGYLIVQQPSNQSAGTLPTDLKRYLHAKSTKLLTLDELLPEGPYLALGHHLHQAWRLYPDTLSAFAVAVVPDDSEAVGNPSQGVAKYSHRRI